MDITYNNITAGYIKSFRPSITVRSDSPGIGKTTYTASEIKNNPDLKIVIISETHLTLDEVKNKLPQSETAHWKGHDQICPVQELHGLSPDIACQLCQYFGLFDPDKCPYKQQFKSKRIVLMPFEFLFTSYADKLSPDLIWVEESCYKLRKWEEPPNHVINMQSEISGLPLHKIVEYPNLAEKRIIEYLKSLEPDEAIETAKIVFNPRPKEIAEYYDRLYSNKPLKVPYLVFVYRYALQKHADILITDANFSMDIWKYVLSVHNYLENGHPLPEPQIQHLNFQKYEDSIIYRIGRGWYPRQTFSNPKSLKIIAETIEKLAFYFRLITIPIITFKSVADKLKSYLYKYDVQVLHFGNLRTRNDFAEYPLGFVVGTYNIGAEEMNKILEDYAPWASKDQTKIHRYHYTDEDAEALRKWFEDAEMYQAIHRFRPLRKPTIIFVWGLVPESIKEEMSVIEVKDVNSLIKKWCRNNPKPAVDEGLALAEEFIRFYGSEYVPIAEIKEYLVQKGLSYHTAVKVIDELKKRYDVYEVGLRRGRPKQYLIFDRTKF